MTAPESRTGASPSIGDLVGDVALLIGGAVGALGAEEHVASDPVGRQNVNKGINISRIAAADSRYSVEVLIDETWTSITAVNGDYANATTSSNQLNSVTVSSLRLV